MTTKTTPTSTRQPTKATVLAPDGLLVVDKPADWTSHDVVGRTRRLAQTKKVGHAGTLDPMATGILVFGIGRGTKLLTFLVGCDKTYTATIRLGQATITDDAEGDITAYVDPSGITREAIAAEVARLTGPIEQVPSSVSAIKIKGERSYARVRAGENVELPARPITVHAFDINEIREVRDAQDQPVIDVDVVVSVSSGTYIRALARDLGAALGVGGHLTVLRRSQVGQFDLAMATPLADLSERVEAGEALPIIPLADAARASFAVRDLTEAEVIDLGHGKRIPSAQAGRTEPVAAIGPDGRLIAMLDEKGKQTRSHVVFAPAGS